MKKDLAVIGGLILFIVVLIIFGGGFTSMGFGRGQSSTASSQPAKTSTKVTLGPLSIDADIAATPTQQQKGLSKKDSMPLARGLLFVFDKPSNYTFWMKDMRFAIDILWIDESKKVIFIAREVRPEPGKSDADLAKYKPEDANAAAKYVLEINAGLSDLNNIHVGDVASFQL